MRYRADVLALCYLLLVGCSQDSAERLLTAYPQRLSNLLEQPIADTPTVQLTPLPPRRERTLPLTDLRAGILDALELAECGLLPLISERNSILGKVMQPSVQMSYEFRFYLLLRACLEQDQRAPLDDSAFSIQLAEIEAIKRRELPRVAWNAAWRSEELERNLSLSRPALSLEHEGVQGASLRALQRLNALRALSIDLTTDTSAAQLDFSDLENHYQALYANEYGSHLITAIAQLSNSLNRAAATLNARLDRRPICLTGKPTTTAITLKQFFQGYYAEQIQPYLSRTDREGEPWLMAAFALANEPPLHQGERDGMAVYRKRMLDTQNPDGLWQQYQQSIQRHTQAWQRLLRECGLMPQG